MTESEAKKKWCPFSRSIHFVSGPSPDGLCELSAFVSANRAVSGKSSFPCKHSLSQNCCIGSACMAWNENEGCMMMRQPVDRAWRRTEAGKNA